jgi:hypothetical protein
MLSANIDWAVADTRQRLAGGIIPLTLKKHNMLRNTAGSRFTTGLRSRIFRCKSNRLKKSTI